MSHLPFKKNLQGCIAIWRRNMKELPYLKLGMCLIYQNIWLQGGVDLTVSRGGITCTPSKGLGRLWVKTRRQLQHPFQPSSKLYLMWVSLVYLMFLVMLHCLLSSNPAHITPLPFSLSPKLSGSASQWEYCCSFHILLVILLMHICIHCTQKLSIKTILKTLL